ncbi:uncharacterized protein LOC127862994 [Dreissena polymorpha]|uniref:Uncharacterized protein n=1 Tax=Dreissena polymorpha TaxID=45954 RepID=A0A9D4BG73_DREPO|nr:uncharacterized protein LOC127862994 [Dreissena polymorpha]KAH3694300.1 hypothetical protein DPMN_081740 [Dreissena polymorpha]
MAEGGTDRSMPETERVPIHGSLYSRHSRNHVEGVSVEVCNIMTRLGYGEEIRQRRVEKYREYDMMCNELEKHLMIKGITTITVGSKGEGLTCLQESDNDKLLVLNRFLCVEPGVDIHTIPDDIQVYRMDTRVYPGHCLMLLERPTSTGFTFCNNAQCDDGKGNVMLSSSLFLHEMSKCNPTDIKNVIPLERAGPSLPWLGQNVNLDMVWALRCQCPGILKRWAERPRHWPPSNVVQKVVSFGSVVTPVGFKGSENSFLEWRICFNVGEIELVSNLNDTQAKLYVILKMILKEVVKPNKKEITSFVLKNIIFWQAENNSLDLFQKRNLIHWLHDALGTHRTVISC